jgi:hypothetical protein
MKQLVFSLFFAIGATLLIAGSAFAQGSGGVSSDPAFYVDGTLYRTVGTPTDLSNTGAPDHSFDVIYNFGGNQLNVATAAPGYPDYNGGRWRVHALAFPNGYAAAVAANDGNGSGSLDTTAEVQSALADGSAVDTGIVKSFVCPVIKFPENG